MSYIDVRDLTFAYPGSAENIFEHASFRLDTDWKLGFTGRNGRGKTTFLNLLMGKYPYCGTISHSVDFDYYPFPVQDDSVATADVLTALCPGEPHWKLQRELRLLEVDESILGRPFRLLSNGERTKALLAALFLRENRFLLIDEPTNHLDLHGRRLVGNYLGSKKGFLLVSHDRAFLDACVDHILTINKTGMEIVQGNFSSWYQNRQAQEQSELAENERLKKEIRRLGEASREKADWSDRVERTKYATKNAGLRADRGFVGHKSAKLMRRAKAIANRQQSAIAEKSGLLKNLETSETLKIVQPAYHAARFAALQDVSIRYGDAVACEHVTFTIERGDRIALLGRNGSGKSSIVKLLSGAALSYTGTLTVGSRLSISYVPQDTAFLCGSLSSYAAERALDESLFKTILRKLDFSRAQFEKDMRDFSDGQKKKVLIAGSLSEKAHLLVWDEPLNFIDVLSRMQIESLLLSCRPTILFVEHDRAFCEGVATKEVRLP